jgi:hypothetical protein
MASDHKFSEDCDCNECIRWFFQQLVFDETASDYTRAEARQHLMHMANCTHRHNFKYNPRDI